MTPQRFWSVGIGALASITLAGFLGTQALEWGSGSKERAQHFQYASGITHIEVDTDQGSITLQPSSNGTTSVERTVRESLRAASRGISRQGGTLHLTGGCRDWLTGPCSVSYVISVPAGISVDAATGSGPINASGLDGRTELATSSGGIDATDIDGSLSAATSSGPIEVADVDGAQIRLLTGSGHINADKLTSTQVDAETGSGGIDLDLVKAPDDLRARTGSGHATVTLPDGVSYDVRTDVGSGRTNVTVERDSDSTHHIDVETGSGGVTVDYR